MFSTIPSRFPWLSPPGGSPSENAQPTDCRRQHCRTRPGRASCRKADPPVRSLKSFSHHYNYKGTILNL